MQLNINSPSYYKNVYGVDDEIYWFCRGISGFVSDKNYSELVDRIGITPIVVPDEFVKMGKWKEETKYDLKGKLIIVKRYIDFNKYVEASIEEKKKLMLGNILKSMKAIKSKGKLNYSKLEAELLEFLGYSKEEIYNYF